MKESCIYCDNLLWDGFCYACYYSDCINWSSDLNAFFYPDPYDLSDIDIQVEEDDDVLFV